ncbi:DeoR/GlpR family DNA-binding transcription regulator [Chitinophaga sp. GCM10012297]|uniref:DeoR/GlpR transcriptional regulator n=1 Tax=Chitinophaga chungangae TaxID=2821488 RepID=A0ABS3YHW0_9BACT|nr:DeoR/GlpR family DNA-binding transcription regulator [Chitinophaga chungangae]MBO9154278.1 DeoR/GlpR transcriptional regulator [Chitinophaga chungangae]
MLKEERQNFILHEVNVHNKVLTTYLVEKLGVSEDTIRRDLNELAEAGRIIKVHGGALSRSFHNSFNSTDIYSLAEKKAIARKAVHLIQDGMFVFTTGGTTILEMARMLPENLRATFFTGSLPAAFEYVEHPHIDVILIGDRLSKNSRITVGGAAIAQIRQVKADLCFLGTNAIDIHAGLTDNDLDVVQIKKAMVESSSRVVSLSISEKVNTSQRLKVCDATDIDTLITELDPDDMLLKPYRAAGMEVL